MRASMLSHITAVVVAWTELCRDAAVALDAIHLLEAERSRQVLVLMRKLKKHRKQLESMRIKAKGVSLLPRTQMVKRPALEPCLTRGHDRSVLSMTLKGSLESRTHRPTPPSPTAAR